MLTMVKRGLGGAGAGSGGGAQYTGPEGGACPVTACCDHSSCKTCVTLGRPRSPSIRPPGRSHPSRGAHGPATDGRHSGYGTNAAPEDPQNWGKRHPGGRGRGSGSLRAPRGRSSMARVPAFQAGYAGSIPVARSFSIPLPTGRPGPATPVRKPPGTRSGPGRLPSLQDLLASLDGVGRVHHRPRIARHGQVPGQDVPGDDGATRVLGDRGPALDGAVLERHSPAVLRDRDRAGRGALLHVHPTGPVGGAQAAP